MAGFKSASTVARRNKIIFSLLIGGLLMGLLMLGIFVSDPNKDKPNPVEQAKIDSQRTERDYTIDPAGQIDNEQVWRHQSSDELQKNQEELSKLQQQVEEMRKALEQAQVYQREYPQGSPEAVAKIPPAILQPKRREVESVEVPDLPSNLRLDSSESRRLPPPPSLPTNSTGLAERAERLNRGDEGSTNTSDNSTQGGVQNNITRNGIVRLSISGSNSKDERDSQEPLKTVRTYVPAGAFGRVVLLSGVDAPTGGQATTNPVPVLMRFKDKGTLANFFKTDLKECTVIGAAAGDISSERANIRLETITCVLKDGRVIEQPIKGYVAGEDGKAGLRGVLVSKQGSLIAKSALAGIASGMGKSVTDQYQTVSTSALGTTSRIDPSHTLEAGAATGFGNAMEKIADFYIQRANETYPIIEIDSQRVGDLILTVGVDFKVDHLQKKRGE